MPALFQQSPRTAGIPIPEQEQVTEQMIHPSISSD